MSDCLDEAATLVARHGDTGAIRAQHRRRPDGRCTCCGPATHWPCLHIAIAERADRLNQQRQPTPTHPSTNPYGAPAA